MTTAEAAAGPWPYRISVDSDPARTAFVASSVLVSGREGRFGVGDLTGDGILDVASTASFPNRIVVLPGLGDGRVGPESTTVADPVPAGENPLWAVAVADLDSDGDDDLVYSRNRGFWSWDEGFRTFLQSDGHLTAGAVVGGGGVGEDVVPADMNADGHVDLVLTSLYSPDEPYPYPTYGTTVALNDGAGHFTTGPSFAHTWRWARAGDVDADGRVDLVGTSSWYRQLADGSFEAKDLPQVGHPDGDVAVADLTGDGRPDVVRTDRSGSRVWVHPGAPGGGFGTPATYAAGIASTDALPLTLADVDGDGRTDVVVDNVQENVIRIWYQKADGTSTSPDRVKLPGLASGWREHIRVVDLDQDGTAEIVTPEDDLTVLRQIDLDTPGLDDTLGHGWVARADPRSAHVRGRRPSDGDGHARGPDPGVVGDPDHRAARRRAGRSGRALTRTYDAATRTIRLTPSTNLSPGGHYEVVVSGLVDTAGAVQPEPSRTWFTVAAGGSRFTPVSPSACWTPATR